MKFPPAVDSILSGLNEFPCLDTLSLGFAWPGDSDPVDEYKAKDHSERNQHEDDVCAWEAMIEKTMELLVGDSVPRLKSLEIRNLVWTFVEPYETPNFRTLLKQLECFSISLRGGNGDTYGHVDFFPGYYDCLHRFDKLFCKHLNSATAVKLEAPDDGLAYGGPPYLAPLGLRNAQMPLLKCLHYKNIVLCSTIVDFVSTHINTLERLVLHRAVSSLDDEESYTWAKFFDALYHAGSKKLSYLEILPKHAPFDDPYDPDVPPAELLERTKQVEGAILENPDLYVFPYLYTDMNDGWGHSVAGLETQAAFRHGADQMAYERLMRAVRANAARPSSES